MKFLISTLTALLLAASTTHADDNEVTKQFTEAAIAALGRLAQEDSPTCYICGEDQVNQVTNPTHVITLPSFVGVDTITCEEVRLAGEVYNLLPSYSCEFFSGEASVQSGCGCTEEEPLFEQESLVVEEETPATRDLPPPPGLTIAPSSNVLPSDIPSIVPSDMPSDLPSTVPSDLPSTLPSDAPSLAPVQFTLASDMPSLTPNFRRG